MNYALISIQCKSEDNTSDLVVKYEENEASYSEEIVLKTEFIEHQQEKPSVGLGRASKKISKEKPIEARNAEKFVMFFRKWRDMKRLDESVRQQTKFWFSSYNKKLNKTYIYRDFFESVRLHFRLAISGSKFNFENFTDEKWRILFANLTDFLRNEVYTRESTVDRKKKSQVVPVWIEGIDSFTLEEFPQYLHQE
eukprot:CAMPEP_0176407404 /NCGR_PEP_ID=MMETSP0127-20121128/1394_1 /TAXON_ID=938130 /ORGANISM="Platyophrya macrostoma, Strain WH" /LENGTH=194 /DNA_ID=CAMNT_0017786609 /DNA_START=31 /DNA_END=615 /DNA_ORIENTATION=-